MSKFVRRTITTLSIAALATISVSSAVACTRALFVGEDSLVITGRTMDWKEDMSSNLWVFPAGMNRDGAAGNNPIKWVSKYGSVVTSGYEAGSADGMNEKGLVANLLYLAESKYPVAPEGGATLSIAAWPQYVLDNFSTVAQTVEALKKEPFTLIAPALPNGSEAALHLAISDSSGDSAIFEYIDKKLIIHHDKKYKVMTNSPSYDKQIALNEYWKEIGGETFMPGTNRAADRFVRTSFLLDAIPTTVAPDYIRGVPNQDFTFQAVAEVMSVMRSVSVPLGISTPNEPNISSTLWRTVADQKNRVYYFDSSTRPNTFWVSMDKLDLTSGAPVKKLVIQDGEVFGGEVSSQFQPSEPFKFLAPH